MFSNLKTKPKILLGSAAPLALLVLLAGIGIWAIGSINQTGKWVTHTYEVLIKADGIVSSAVDMETGMRGYLLAGKEDFLDPYKNGQEQVYERIAALQETVNDNPKQVARLGEVEKTLREWQQNVTEPAIQLRREIGDSKTMNDMAKLVGEARGKAYFDKFREQIATFIEREQKLMSARKATMESMSLTSADDAKTFKETLGWVTHTYDVIDTAKTILAAAVDMETGMRGYLLAGKEDFLDPYKNGSTIFYAKVEDLKKTVSDNPAQVELLGEMAETMKGWQADVVEPMINLRREIGDAKTMDDIADLVGQAKGKVYFDKFRSLMAEFKGEEEALMGTRQEAAVSTTNTANSILWGGGIAAVLIGIILSWVIGSGIATPIGNMTKSMIRLAEGNLDVEVPGTGRKDEIGDMAEAVQVFKDNAIEVKRLEEEQKLAEQRAAEQRKAEMNKLASDFESNVGSIVKSVGDSADRIKGSAGTLAAQATQAKSTAAEVAVASEEATSNVQTVASAAEELSSSITEISGQVGQSTKIASRAVEEANRTNGMVQGLSEAAQRIGEVVDLINDIAEQTNLLALNATIEAARAGDAGKGFAVVASEVKNLANQTGKATEEISSQIDGIRNATVDAVKAIGDITGIISEMNEITSAVAAAVEEQGAATQEIARNVDHAAAGTQQVSSNMTTVVDVADKTGNSANEMRSAADDLSSQAENLENQVSAFIQQVRAG
jgi:methyl-accepting chemotaxis protein